jgi:hypothetical protein
MCDTDVVIHGRTYRLCVLYAIFMTRVDLGKYWYSQGDVYGQARLYLCAVPAVFPCNKYHAFILLSHTSAKLLHRA